MDERVKFIARVLEGEKVAVLAREFGISRKTAYKIIDRYDETGLEGLTDRSRRPYRHANQLPFQIEKTIVRLKQEKPTWGAPKLLELLARRYPDVHRPAISTIHAVFDRHGLVKHAFMPAILLGVAGFNPLNANAQPQPPHRELREIEQAVGRGEGNAIVGSDCVLAVENLGAAYGDARALHGISLSVKQGETLALIGANGAGKSTLLKCICGLLRSKTGAVQYQGEDISSLPAHEIVRRGIALVPEGRRLFPSLSVAENLLLGGQIERPGPWNMDRLYAMFPILREKKDQPATSLSGGQQQMVAIGRALMSNPELILLDELSIGLAPIVIKDIYDRLPDITAGGMTVILVEQDVTRALSSADTFICLQEGRVSLSGTPREHSRDAITTAYFGT